MSEVEKTIGQILVNNLGVVFLVGLFVISLLFKPFKREVDPLGKFMGWLGKKFTKDVREDVASQKKEIDEKFEEIKSDRKKKIDELKVDYNKQIKTLKEDLDSFEKRTNQSIDEMKDGTSENCKLLKNRMDRMERSNDEQTIRQIRAHVLDFANSCMNKRRHTKLEFENIIDEDAQYEALIKKYKIENNVYKEDFNFIMKIYHKCQDENSFLKESDAES